MIVALGLGCWLVAPLLRADVDGRVFEMRTYFAHEGKLDDLLARFRDHTVGLFERHGMENLGYWTPVENSDNKLVYVLAYPSRDARGKAWKAFSQDPEWQRVKEASVANGKLVKRVEKQFLAKTDYSPDSASASGGADRVFELRIYTTEDGRLGNLDARFRNHTMGLFESHGMENIAYWHLAGDEEGAENTLMYLLAHRSKAAALLSWNAFRNDSDWKKAYAASKVAAGGRIVKEGGLKSLYLSPVDFSPIR